MAGTITSLEVQEHNRERVNLYIDGTFAFGIMALEAAKLHKGQVLTDAELAALKAHDSVEMAYERALKLLAGRPRSAGEIRKSLASKKIDSSTIDAVITRLEGQGYLDDLAFARLWVSNRQQFKPQGTRALRFELREKGIATEIIDQVLEGLDADDAAYRAALKKARSLRQLDTRTFRDKLGAYLVRHGFNFDTARSVIDRIISERDTPQSDDDLDAGDWELNNTEE
jgi:regulatory protein